MKRGVVVIFCVLVGCNVVPIMPALTLPDALTRVPGGIIDARPYFGNLRIANNDPSAEFLLATCGCGDWRILITDSDGAQRQFPVDFYTEGEYSPEGSVTVFGRDGDVAALGTLDQHTGQTNGDVETGLLFRRFAATRGEAHTQEVSACVKCHIGEDPIFPQPEGHPVYEPGVTDCFRCHTVTIE